MTYVEKMTMKIMGEMAYNYGNQSEVAEVVRQIIADVTEMSSRDQFAKEAIKAVWPEIKHEPVGNAYHYREDNILAKRVYEIADAMISEREKKEK